MNNNVSHPSHYNSGPIEVIEGIESWNLGFHLGNAVKYIARAGRKDPSKLIEDLEKAIWYIERHIERVKAAKEGREACKPNDMGNKMVIKDTTPDWIKSKNVIVSGLFIDEDALTEIRGTASSPSFQMIFSFSKRTEHDIKVAVVRLPE